MRFEDVVFHQVENYVQREGEVRSLSCILFDEPKGFRAIGRKLLSTHGNGGLADVEAQIPRVLGKPELMAIAAAEFDRGLHVVLGNESVEDIRLEGVELAEPADS